MNIDDRITALELRIAELHVTATVHGVNFESLHLSATSCMSA